VQAGVGGEPRAEVAGPGGPPHRGQQPPGLAAGPGAEVPGGHRQGQRLQQDPAGVDVVELGRVQARHLGPLVRLDLDQALFLQHPQHLPQRGPADAELGGQAHLGQLGPRRQGAVEDAFPQVRVDVRDGLPGFGQVDPANVGDLHDTGHGLLFPSITDNCIQFSAPDSGRVPCPDESRCAYSLPPEA